METIWMIPVHVRPVVSFEGIARNEIRDPVSGLDRFNMTDIGEIFHNKFSENGADIVIKGAVLPFPWEMVFKIGKEPKASLRGLKVGPSTYRSIFKMIFINTDDVNEIIKRSLDEIGRGVLDSPYWEDATWQLFQNIYKMSRTNVIESNDAVMERL